MEEIDDLRYPLPHELIGKTQNTKIRKIVRYLDSGQVFRVYRGHSWCRFLCGPLGHRELTDGEWVWPEGLSHYVLEHSVILPAEFTSKVFNRKTAQAYEIPLASSVDDAYWVDWCDRNRTRLFNKCIDPSSGLAPNRVRQRQIAKTESELGLSALNCHTNLCQGRAVRGRALCASCITELLWKSSLAKFGLRKIISKCNQFISTPDSVPIAPSDGRRVSPKK